MDTIKIHKLNRIIELPTEVLDNSDAWRYPAPNKSGKNTRGQPAIVVSQTIQACELSEGVFGQKETIREVVTVQATLKGAMKDFTHKHPMAYAMLASAGITILILCVSIFLAIVL